MEPFVGSGALFFHLCPLKAVISDVHSELIAFYQAIKDGKSREIYDFMLTHPNEEKTYYFVRDEMLINDDLDLAKRFYYQRKTCFRGITRYNKKGQFNICFGRYKSINFEELLNGEYEKLPQLAMAYRDLAKLASSTSANGGTVPEVLEVSLVSGASTNGISVPEVPEGTVKKVRNY